MKAIDQSGSVIDMELDGELYRGPKNASPSDTKPVLLSSSTSNPRAPDPQADAPVVAKDVNVTTSIERNRKLSEGNAVEDSSMEASAPCRENGRPKPPQSCDVVFGAVSKQRWPGNSLFNKLVQQRRQAADKEESAAVIARIVRRRGGQFFYCQSVDGTIQYRPCTEEQTVKYTVRHLESATKSKLFSACTASHLQLLYTTHESTSTPQVTPPPLEVKWQMVSALLSEVEPFSRTVAIAGASKANQELSARNPCTEANVRLNKETYSNYTSAYPYPYYHPHYQGPPYSYYPYPHYPHYPASYSGMKEPTERHSPSSTESVPPLSTDEPNSAAHPGWESVKPPPTQGSANAASEASGSSAANNGRSRGPESSKMDVTKRPNQTKALSISRSPATKRVPKKSRMSSSPLSDEHVYQPMRVAHLLNGDPQTYLPRGVTVRPSGKWQAQIYFCGQSRYIGVYDNALMASVAYTTASHLLKTYKATIPCLVDKDSREANQLVEAARKLSIEAAATYHKEFGVVTLSDSKKAVKSAQAAIDFATTYFKAHASEVNEPPTVRCD